MTLEDLMKNFVGKIVNKGKLKQCEMMKPCLALDAYEYTVVMMLLKSKDELEGSGIQVQINSENLMVKSRDFITEICWCTEQKNRISYATSVGNTTRLLFAKEYVISYLASAVMQINLATTEQERYQRRNYNKVYGAMAMLTPYAFVTINMNLIYSYIKCMGMASGMANENLIKDLFVRNVADIVDVANDKAILECRKNYLMKYRELFAEEVKNISYTKLMRQMERKFTGIDILSGASYDMQYLPHLSMIRRFVEKVLEIYGPFLLNDNILLQKYINVLKWLDDSEPNCIHSQKAVDKWVNKISEIKTEIQFLDVIKSYCNEYNLLLAEDITP